MMREFFLAHVFNSSKKNLVELFKVSLVSVGHNGKICFVQLHCLALIPQPGPGLGSLLFSENGVFQLYRSLIEKKA